MKKIAILVSVAIAIAAGLHGQENRDALEMYRQGNFEKAVEICLTELKEMPRNMNSYVVLGWSLLKLKRYQDVLQYAGQALAISPYDGRVVQMLGEANFNLGKNADALKYLQEYVSLSPSGELIDEVYAQMGEVYLRQGQFNRADIAFTTAVYHNPRNAAWWTRLGYAREQARDTVAAKSAYEKAIALNPASADAQRGLQRLSGQ